MFQNVWEMLVDQPPPRVPLLPSACHIVIKSIHFRVMTVFTVVENGGICIVDSEGGHLLWGGLHPGVDHRSCGSP